MGGGRWTRIAQGLEMDWKEKKKKQACSLTQRKTLPYPSRLLTTNPALRNKTDKQRSGPCILGITW